MVTKKTAFKAVIAEIPAQLDLDQMDVLNRKVDQMLRLMDDQVHLQKVSLLEAGHMLRFNGPKGRRISLSLPDAQDDYVQRVILRTRSFYEARLLATVEAMGDRRQRQRRVRRGGEYRQPHHLFWHVHGRGQGAGL